MGGMGSPSSTAAYLMNVSHWDDEAVAYLKHVIQYAAGKGSRGIPSVYPSTYFELSALLASRFSPADLESPGLNKIAGIFSQGP
ncbi:hypothetical protein F5X99DRAFT_410669 [Biscogniauxia marginata]|nr:hypothetical protein F5X99DRAFT_410669 [Biscogniauxia marginata]